MPYFMELLHKYLTYNNSNLETDVRVIIAHAAIVMVFAILSRPCTANAFPLIVTDVYFFGA